MKQKLFKVFDEIDSNNDAIINKEELHTYFAEVHVSRLIDFLTFSI